MKTVTGTLSLHPRGFGFLLPNGDDKPSAFVPPPDLNRFFAGDRVQATITQTADGRFTASSLQLVQRDRREVFGQVVSHRGQRFLRVDREVANTDWRLECVGTPPAESVLGTASIADGHVLWIGPADPSCDPSIERVIVRHEIPKDFPCGALEQASVLACAPIAPTNGRRNLRDVPTVTIDAASTRDIDDAVSVLPADKDGAVRLIVSIADVSALIQEGTDLDREALRRGTSVYLPDRVLPMLPADLSESRASLLPDVDRECITAELRISPEGECLSVDVYRSVIRSDARLTYDQVAAFLDRNETATLTPAICELLTWCRTVSSRLQMSRAKRGGVEMARDEARYGIDASTGRPTVLEPLRTTSAHLLIERCMVAANEGVANWLHDRGMPAPYRVHDAPSPEDVDRLERIARNFGFAPGFAAHLTPLALGAFDRQIRSTLASPAILSVLAHALGPARYTATAAAHFGLGSPRYLHFTSPIRRYADLLVHRAVGAYLDGARPSNARPEALELTCREISTLQARAAKAESDSQRVVSARFMASRVGESFHANVTGVRPFGLRVQLRDSLVVGHVQADTLPGGPFTYSDDAQELVGGSATFAVGTPLRVTVARTDESAGRIEFELANVNTQPS